MGEEIPLFARIINLVASYDCLIEGGPIDGGSGRAPRSKEEAIKEIKKRAGTLFDPHITKVFIDMLQE